MARTALKTKDDPDHVTRVAKEQRKRARVKRHKSKKFEDLNATQKDELLKALAVRAGLVEDSDDT